MLMPVVRRHLATFARSGRPALAARARNIRSRISAAAVTGDAASGPRPKRRAAGAAATGPVQEGEVA